jgi:hypothetical protein
MEITKTKGCLVVVVILLAGVVWRIERMGAGHLAGPLSNRDMSRITGKCCSKTEDCGFDCSGNEMTCTGCSGPCMISIVAGTQPQCCDTSGTGTCQHTGYVTCQTYILSHATVYQSMKCTTVGGGETCGPGSYTDACALCSNGDSYPVRRLNQACNSS